MFYTSLDSYTFSEPTSINSFLHDFNGDIQDGEYAFTKNKFEIGVRKSYYSLALVSRYDYFVEFNNELARAYHDASHDIVPSEGDSIDVYIKSSHLRAYGLKYGLHWQPAEGLTLLASISGLSADQMVDGKANGAVGYLGKDEYRGAVHFNLYSYRDLLLDAPVPSPKGLGYSIDFGLNWQINSQWYLQMRVEDAYSRIKWQDILYSNLLATSATVYFDQAGRLHTNPAVSGLQVLKDMTQSMPVQYGGQLHYNLNDRHGIYIDALHISSYLTMPVYGYSYRLSQDKELRWSWNGKSKALGMQYQNKGFRANLATDNLSGRKAHSWNFSLSWEVPTSL